MISITLTGLLFCLVFIRNVQNISKQCPSGWSYNTDRCYYIKTSTSEEVKHQTALSRCSAKGAKLAVPNSADEFVFMGDIVSTFDAHYYIGLVDKYSNNTFYADDFSTTYQKWCGSEPQTNGSLDGLCAMMHGGCLMDIGCINTYYYLCEKASCTSSQYYNETAGSCATWGSCSTASDCGSGSNMVCNDGTCSCDTNYIWTGSACELCPSGWSSRDTSCYSLVKTSLTYGQALAKCKGHGMGSTLAIPNSVDEISYLTNMTVAAAGNSFLGIYDYGNKDFRAIDGSTASFKWCSNEPSAGAKASSPEACVVMSSSKQCMIDKACTDTFYYICEINKQ